MQGLFAAPQAAFSLPLNLKAFLPLGSALELCHAPCQYQTFIVYLLYKRQKLALLKL